MFIGGKYIRLKGYPHLIQVNYDKEKQEHIIVPLGFALFGCVLVWFIKFSGLFVDTF